MKVRTGFVSNSSSSSFVVAGIKVPQEVISGELREQLWEMDLLVLSGGEGGAPHGFTIIGKEFAQSEDWGIEYSELSLDKISQMIGEVEAATNLTGDRGVFTGTRAC